MEFQCNQKLGAHKCQCQMSSIAKRRRIRGKGKGKREEEMSVVWRHKAGKAGPPSRGELQKLWLKVTTDEFYGDKCRMKSKRESIKRHLQKSVINTWK